MRVIVSSSCTAGTRTVSSIHDNRNGCYAKISTTQWSRIYEFESAGCLSAGGLSQGLAATFNLGPIRNALALWLGIEPADLFLYIFLPPMLLDAAVRIDYFLLKKVRDMPESSGAPVEHV